MTPESTELVSATNTTLPRTYGVVLFRMFDLLDVHGPIEILQFLSGLYPIDIALIAETMDPVTSEPSLAAMNPFNFRCTLCCRPRILSKIPRILTS